jgi:hypothetical protein
VRSVECVREQDVLDALLSGRWPDRTPDDLRAHVESCAICADTVTVAGPILSEPDDFPAEARIPSSAVMWWRAQMRARQEAAREAARPITVAQVVGAVCALALIVALAVAFSPLVRGVLTDTVSSLALSQLDVQSVLVSQGWLMLALMAGVLLVLTPVAIYLAVAED